MIVRSAPRVALRAVRQIILFILILFLAILACNYPPLERRQAKEGFSLAPRTPDGTVSGSYVYPDSRQNKIVNFSVSVDGQATFQVEGALPSERLTVSLRDKSSSEMSWSGLTLDGYGALSQDEQSNMQALGNSELWHALSLIPLETACQGEDQVEPQQLAALLFPLQMYFKYQIAERGTAALELIALSDCLDSDEAGNPTAQRSQIYLTAADPIPVVFGYFPFDAEGAIEQPFTELAGQQYVSLAPMTEPGLAQVPAIYGLTAVQPGAFFQAIRDQQGPCQAKCRGACGPDCTLNNCKLTADYRCEVDADGNNTGQISYLHIYDCGLHPACIHHDQCYDDCNQRYGCGTFKAAHCRHGGWTFTGEIPDDYYCDLHTVLEEETENVKGWVDGYGPQPTRQVYVYTDPNLGYLDDLENCPLPTAGPTIFVEPTDTAEPTSNVDTEERVLVYEGIVAPAEGQDLEIRDSEVVIEISGDLVSVKVAMTFAAKVKWQQNQVLCTAIMDRVYLGQGPLTVPLDLTLDLLSSQDELEGSDCKGVNVPVISSQKLVGEFDDKGSFLGNIRNVWIIYATKTND
jgi:hypothetical protein